MADKYGPSNYRANQKSWWTTRDPKFVRQASDVDAAEMQSQYGKNPYDDTPGSEGPTRKYTATQPGNEHGGISVQDEGDHVNLNPDEHEVKDNFKALRRALLGVK